jgi:UDP-2,3-diacylglucosamine pyrophosphatase LpxH
MLFPGLLAKGLSRVLKAARESGPIPLGEQHHYVIFSDLHKGAGTGADDFKACKETYLRALDYYFSRDYKLIILGDAEELWEESIEKVLATHGDVFESEKRFHQQNRYMRIFGNHDNNWASKGQIAKHLHPIFPGLEVSEGLVFSFSGPSPASSGELFLAHGHQGTLDSEVFPSVSRFFVRTVWRTLQIVTGYSGTQPSKKDSLRGAHDTLMYEWAAKQGKMLLMAGHTHREIWSSRTELDRKRIQVQAMEATSQDAAGVDRDAQLARLRAEYKVLQADERFKYDSIKTRGCYFNDGCCCFSDGSVTAYELENGVLRLVRWEENSQQPNLVDAGRLADIFAVL